MIFKVKMSKLSLLQWGKNQQGLFKSWTFKFTISLTRKPHAYPREIISLYFEFWVALIIFSISNLESTIGNF